MARLAFPFLVVRLGRPVHWALVCLALVSFPCTSSAVRGRYEIGDWVSWTSMRQVNDIEEYLNVLYVASDGGVARYDLMTHRWKKPLTVADGLMARRVLAIHLDPVTADLIYRTPQGIGSFSLLGERDNAWFKPTPEIEQQLTPSDPSRPYPNAIPPPGYHFQGGLLIDRDLREYPVIDKAVDFWGNTWLGIRSLGVAVIEWNTLQMRLLAYGLWNDDVRALDRQGDTFWFVGPSAINTYDRYNDTWDKFEAFNIYDLHSDDVRDVLIDSTFVWLATSDGLSRYDRVGDRWRTFTRFDGLPDSDVRTLAADSGSLWVGTRFGMARLDRATSRVTDVSRGSFGERTVNDIGIIDTAVWVGTSLGLERTLDRGKTWTRFTADEPILDAAIYVIAVHGDELWCATRLGIIGYNTKLGRAERLPAGIYFGADSIGGQRKQVHSLLVVDSLLWVGTDEGIARYDRRTGYSRNFSTEDGLIDNRVFDIELDGDCLWFATPGGVTRFYWNNPYRID